MKKFSLKTTAITLILVFVMTSLAACGKSGKDASVDEGTTKETQTEEGGDAADQNSDKADTVEATDELVPEEGAELVLWMDNDTYNEKIVELWEAKYPDVPLTVENVGTTTARGKLELDGPAGMGADVFVQPHDGVAISAETGLILEVDYFTDYIKENFMENAIEAVTYKDKVYAFPLSIKTIALFYNKDLVEKPVTTWDEMRAFAAEYNNPSQNKFALLWQAVDSYFAHGFLSGYGYEIFGPDHNDPAQLGWDSPEAIEGMKFYQTLNDIYPVASADATWDAMNSMFSGGQAPYVITGPWSIADFKKAGVNFGVTKLPTLPNGKQPISLSTVDTVCVSSFTQYPQASMLLAKFLTDEDAMKLLYETKNELPASIVGQQYDFVVNDVYLQGVAEQAEFSLPMPYIPEMANVWAPYAKAFTAVWDEIQTPEEALSAALEEFNSTLVK